MFIDDVIDGIIPMPLLRAALGDIDALFLAASQPEPITQTAPITQTVPIAQTEPTTQTEPTAHSEPVRLEFWRQPCDCGANVRHHNGGNYHQRMLVSRSLNKAVLWDTRESMGSLDGAVVYVHPSKGDIQVAARSWCHTYDDYEYDRQVLEAEGYVPLAYCSGASEISVEEADKLADSLAMDMEEIEL